MATRPASLKPLPPDQLARALGIAMAEAEKPLRERLEAIEKTLDPKTIKLVRGITKGVAAVIRPLLQNIESELDELRNSTVRYFGTFINGAQYSRNCLVTDRGCMWICLQNTTERPGNSAHWKLAAKGRDIAAA